MTDGKCDKLISKGEVVKLEVRGFKDTRIDFRYADSIVQTTKHTQHLTGTIIKRDRYKVTFEYTNRKGKTVRGLFNVRELFVAK